MLFEIKILWVKLTCSTFSSPERQCLSRQAAFIVMSASCGYDVTIASPQNAFLYGYCKKLLYYSLSELTKKIRSYVLSFNKDLGIVWLNKIMFVLKKLYKFSVLIFFHANTTSHTTRVDTDSPFDEGHEINPCMMHQDKVTLFWFHMEKPTGKWPIPNGLATLYRH